VIDTTATVVRTEGLLSTTVDDELVVLNLGAGCYVAIDRIGRRIWELLESPWLVDDLIAALATEFDADPSIVAADLAAFLQELEREGMVNAVTPPAVR
jgi:Coenzyme PQQ synthesis protein D (PqqD)